MVKAIMHALLLLDEAFIIDHILTNTQKHTPNAHKSTVGKSSFSPKNQWLSMRRLWSTKAKDLLGVYSVCQGHER